MAGFDGVAGVYQALEIAAFGGALQRARTAFLDDLLPCRHVLVLGDGDGRFAAALVNANAHVQVHCVDSSAEMIRLAASRLTPSQQARVIFEQADAREFRAGARTYDAIVTMFFLDCFVEREVEQLIARLRLHLRPGGLWFFADFSIPSRGWARLHARLVVAALYRFFRWRTRLGAQTLPPSEMLLERASLQCLKQRDYRAGLIRSSVWRAT